MQSTQQSAGKAWQFIPWEYITNTLAERVENWVSQIESKWNFTKQQTLKDL